MVHTLINYIFLRLISCTYFDSNQYIFLWYFNTHSNCAFVDRKKKMAQYSGQIRVPFFTNHLNDKINNLKLYTYRLKILKVKLMFLIIGKSIFAEVAIMPSSKRQKETNMLSLIGNTQPIQVIGRHLLIYAIVKKKTSILYTHSVHAQSILIYD